MSPSPSAFLPERTTFRRFRLRHLPPWCRIGLMKLALLSVLAPVLLQPQNAFAARRMRSAAEPSVDERALVQDGARTWRFGHLTVTALSPFVRGADQYGKTIAFGAFLDESLARPDAPVVEFDEYIALMRERSCQKTKTGSVNTIPCAEYKPRLAIPNCWDLPKP